MKIYYLLHITMNRILLIIIIIVNLIVLGWSGKYLISYASQDKNASIAFAIIFSTALASINLLLCKRK